MGAGVRLRIGIAALAVGGCEPAPETFPEPFATDRGVYSEFLELPAVQAQLDALQEHELELYLAVPSRTVGSDALAQVLRQARRQSIPVRAWLLLDDADGYWPGEDNLPAFRELVDRFWTFNEEQDLGVEWITVDMEPPLSTSNQLAAALEAGKLSEVVPVLLDLQEPEEHAAASAAWREAVDQWHARGMKVGVVGLPYLLDDLADGDAELQDMFESPIVGIDWDEVGFLVYQNLYQDPEGERFGPPLVASYAQTAVEHFGDRAAIALGGIGTVGKNTTQAGYDDSAALTADVAAAWASGAGKVHLFSLDGMVQLGAPRPWLAASSTEPLGAAEDPEVDRVRDQISVLDRL